MSAPRKLLLLALAVAVSAEDGATARPRPPARAQATPPAQQPAPSNTPAPVQVAPYAGPSKILETPVSSLFPGKTTPPPPFRSPVEGDAEAVQRGMGYFNMFNCSGCHAANGGGGMGPSLSNRTFTYGGEPQNIYLTIYQGRPNGMPS